MFKKLFIIFIILTSCSRNKHDDKIISSPEILLDRDLSLVKQIIFNNELRENNGMPKVDSVMFIQDSIISKNKVSYIRKFSKSQSNEIINVEFYHKRGDSLVFDSYKVGNDH